MVTQVKRKKKHSLAEYFEVAANAPERHEYINGEIIPILGGNANHDRIVDNLDNTFNLGDKKQSYTVFITTQRLWIPERRIATYPDVMVVSGNLQLQNDRKDTIANPLIIIEVLATSLHEENGDEKFAAYRTIPSFQEYLVIDQDTIHVERYYKTTQKNWVLSEYESLTDILNLHSFPWQVSLTDIYHQVNFE
jgi:Uma2 family endonuclease